MDLLVKLYELPPVAVPAGIDIRPALASEREPLLDWVEARFGRGWRGEVAGAFGTCPVRCQIAVVDRQIRGFACWDVTAKGLFGPTGVDQEARGRGLGKALLLSALWSLRHAGYAYAVIGGAGPVDFYRAACGAEPIPGSEPGLYRGLVAAR